MRHSFLRVVGSRVLFTAIPLLFVVSALSFLLVSLTPGNAAEQILGANATPAEIAQLSHKLGLDQPIYQQYWEWLSHAVRGDFGTSVFTEISVGEQIAERLPVTLSLMIGALLVSIVVGVGMGMLSAIRGGGSGRVVDALAILGLALPAFWVGAELIVLFAVNRDWFPATGYVTFEESPAEWLRSLVLPVSALSLYGVAATAKQTREAMLEALGSEHIRMAWANGIPARSIFFRHGLKNASMRVVTVLGVQAVGLLGATVFVENVFALPGLGTLVVSAALKHDLPTVTGVAVCFTIIVVLINLIIDVAYTWLNPKVRVG